MKKFLACLSLGALLATGVAFAQDTPVDLSMDREPSVFSIQQSNFF